MVIPDKVDNDRQPSLNPPTDTFPTERLTRRSVRSFVIRNGRTTAAQADALQRLLPEYGIPYTDQAIDPDNAFGRSAPVWLEIGFGNGDVLLDMASHQPHVNIIGAEVHESGIGHALIGMENAGLQNLRLIQHDAMEVLENMLPEASLDKLLLLFPDPWHKKRHHKRRIVQSDFLNAVARTLKPGGTLHCATDWADYGEWMLEHLEADTRFANQAGAGMPSPRPEWRPVTRFEKRGHRLGHDVIDLLYTRNAS